MKYRIAWFRKFGNERVFHLVDPEVEVAENLEIAKAQLKAIEQFCYRADPGGKIEADERRVRSEYTFSYGETITHVYKIIEED